MAHMKTRLMGILTAFAVAGLGIVAIARAGDAQPTVQQPKENPPTVKQPKELTLDCGKGVNLKLVLIPAGEFMMGSPENEAGHDGDEGPLHRVKITKPFHMAVCEVTQAQYEAVMGVNPSYFKGESNPVEQVSWDDAAEFCRKLSAKTGQTVRLPTEAEWEYACRAGTTTPFTTGETISTGQANYDGNNTYGSGRKGKYRQKTVAVGSFAANGFGLYDMHGNVWEWCQDWYDKEYHKNSPTDDPPGPEKGDSRVVRGGSWRNGPSYSRSANRAEYEPVDRDSNVGFRVVCAPRLTCPLKRVQV